MPGDSLYDDAVFVPLDMSLGQYELELAIVDRESFEPVIKLAFEGMTPDGWYPMGKIAVRETVE